LANQIMEGNDTALEPGCVHIREVITHHIDGCRLSFERGKGG